MGRGQVGAVVREVGPLLEGQAAAGLSGRQLLRRYLDRRDESAFAALVAEHGPMVLGVCRRTLGPSADAEDAFQATFLVLARKGGGLGEHVPIGPWLYGVARRVALRARRSAGRRRAREAEAMTAPGLAGSGPGDAAEAREVGGLIDEELGRLPARYRDPVVLCLLEGLTHDQAARQLGWPLGSVKGRLARAREILQGRLARRGLAPAGGGQGKEQGQGGMWAAFGAAPAAVPAPLAESTIRAVLAGAAGGAVPPAVAALAAGSLASMIHGKIKWFAAMLVVLGSGAALAYQAARGDGDGPPNPDPAPAPARPKADPKPASAEGGDWEENWAAQLATPEDKSPKTLAIREKLEERIAMNFPNDTPFEDVKKYIESATQDEAAGLPNGIPIYVNPQGLQDSDKTMASPISINLEGIPLKTTLRLILKQLGLTYVVHDGLLTIDHDGPNSGLAPLAILRDRADRGELSRTQYLQLIELLKLRDQVEKLANPPDPPAAPAARGGGGGGGGFQ